jgi:hypothetical protein
MGQWMHMSSDEIQAAGWDIAVLTGRQGCLRLLPDEAEIGTNMPVLSLPDSDHCLDFMIIHPYL